MVLGYRELKVLWAENKKGLQNRNQNQTALLPYRHMGTVRSQACVTEPQQHKDLLFTLQFIKNILRAHSQ